MIYVDTMRAPLGPWLMCHMAADGIDELLAEADALGLRRRWFQRPPKASWPHFDISLEVKARAVARGARVIDRHELVYRAAVLRVDWARRHDPAEVARLQAAMERRHAQWRRAVAQGRARDGALGGVGPGA